MLKQWQNIFHVIVNVNSIVQISNQKRKNETCQCECKNYRRCKKDYSWNPSTCICENGKYLKSIADTSVVTCYEIISVMDAVSRKTTNSIATNVSVNFDDKKVRYNIDCYILHTVLLVIILLLTITVICYHYVENRSKQRSVDARTI